MKINFMDYVLIVLSVLCLAMGVFDLIAQSFYQAAYMFLCSALNLSVAVICISQRGN